jgi:pantetheine-phosphate adenylyltransferase
MTNTASAVVTRAGTIALFPASFDPPTNGHVDLIERAQQAFDEVVVAVAINVGKTGTFSFEERLEMLESVTTDMDRVRVEGFSGLVVEHAKAMGATVIIRGLRAMSDFEYEFEMALMNRHLEPDLETMFMMARQEYLYVSSSRLKELVRFGTKIDEFVPPLVAERLYEKLGGG